MKLINRVLLAVLLLMLAAPAWSCGYNGSGTYVRSFDWTNDRDASVPITAARMDEEDDCVATALSNALTRDGQAGMTANLAMGSNKITGVASGTAATDAATLGQAQTNVVGAIAGGGTVDAITATYSPALTALADKQILRVVATGANTSTTPSFAPNGLTARTIVKGGGQALIAGDIRGAGYVVELQYNLANTRWEMLNPWFPAAITATAATVLDDTSVANMRSTLGIPSNDNAFTAAQSITLATAGNNLTNTTTDTGATGSTLRQYHNTSSPANSDIPATILFDGKDSGANDQTWGRQRSTITDVTSGSEDATMTFATPVAGTLADRLTITAGLQVGSPTGGDKGAGTVNATAVYDDNVQLLNSIIQIVETTDSAVATGTTIFPQDDTIPQNTEGDQYLSRAITPTSSANLLRIEVSAMLASSVNSRAFCALFQDSTANALTAASVEMATTNQPAHLYMAYSMTAGTTSSTTFNVRCGSPSAGTTTFNGASGARLFGGVGALSWIRVSEIHTQQ